MITEIPYTEHCDRCGKTYGDHCGSECPDREGSFTLKPPTQPNPKAVACFDELMDSARWKWTDTISRYLKEAREEEGKRLVDECDALKASNAELREQLAANIKFISELQHTIRLVQGTHAQQVRECAVKAVTALAKADYIPRNIFADKPVAIICEAFGAPVNEYEDALQKAWEARRALGNSPAFPDFRDGFHAAWKLAKGEKP